MITKDELGFSKKNAPTLKHCGPPMGTNRCVIGWTCPQSSEGSKLLQGKAKSQEKKRYWLNMCRM